MASAMLHRLLQSADLLPRSTYLVVTRGAGTPCAVTCERYVRHRAPVSTPRVAHAHSTRTSHTHTHIAGRCVTGRAPPPAAQFLHYHTISAVVIAAFLCTTETNETRSLAHLSLRAKQQVIQSTSRTGRHIQHRTAYASRLPPRRSVCVRPCMCLTSPRAAPAWPTLLA